MTLNVVVATRNRYQSLRGALESLLAAEIPSGLVVSITVVDNGSSDSTREVVEETARNARLPIRYILEPRAGQAHALNTGIASCDSELIAQFDDDERAGPGWFISIHQAFQDGSVDFVGGPYLPKWEAPPPAWLPRQSAGIIGWMEASPFPTFYRDLPNCSLAGGNAAMRRTLMQRVGPYRVDVAAHHDTDMYGRFVAAGAVGMYLPKMIIYHAIPAERLQKSYFRRWMWRAGRSYARIERLAPRKRIAGVPLHILASLIRAMARTCWQFLRFADPARRFSEELDCIYYFAYVRGCLAAAPNNERN